MTVDPDFSLQRHVQQSLSLLIKDRRTIRSFNSRSVSRELVAELLNAAGASTPMEGTAPACRIVYIASPEGKAKTASAIMATYADQKPYKWLPGKLNKMMTDRIAQIPAFGAVIMKEEGKQERDERRYAAVCALLQSFSLLAWEHGIGMVWNTEPFLDKPAFKKDMGLKPDERFVCILYMGYYDKKPKMKNRIPAAQKLTYL